MIIMAATMSGCRLFSTSIDTSDSYTQNLLKGQAIKEVRAKMGIWGWFGDPQAYVTIGETLYVDKESWTNDLKRHRGIYLHSILAHESVHTLRQANMGTTYWILMYVCSKSFRWEEEKIAYKAGWNIEVDAGIPFHEGDYDYFAKYASGPLYYHMTSYEEAYNFIREAITQLKEKKTK